MKKYVTLFCSIFIVDVVAKLLALSWCGDEIVLNKGISWSIFHSSVPAVSRLVICVVTAFICFFIFYTMRQMRLERSIWGETCVLAGAISNLIDRLIYGGVVDFIHLSFCGYSFPIFNIADIAISVGAALILWKELRS